MLRLRRERTTRSNLQLHLVRPNANFARLMFRLVLVASAAPADATSTTYPPPPPHQFLVIQPTMNENVIVNRMLKRVARAKGP